MSAIQIFHVFFGIFSRLLLLRQEFILYVRNSLFVYTGELRIEPVKGLLRIDQ